MEKKPNLLRDPVELTVAVIFIVTVMVMAILLCGVGWGLEYGGRSLEFVWYLLLDYPRLTVVSVFSVVVGLILLGIRGFSFRRGHKQ